MLDVYIDIRVWIYVHLTIITCPLLEKLLKEPNKTVFFLGDCNINLLNFNTSEHVTTFLVDLASNSMQP